jgi:ABC-type transporter Mla subunit MlaD
MAGDRTYAKLGLFIVIGTAVIVATALFFIKRMQTRSVVPFVTYTTENVSGLDVSNPVRYRGVAVGRISDLRVDPRQRGRIEIDFEVFRDRLTTIGASLATFERMAALPMVPNMRAQVIGNPITGEAYLLLDFPDNPPPPPDLGFTPRSNYVASMPSPIAAIQDRLPAILERTEATLATLRAIVARIPESLDRSDRFFASIDRTLREGHLRELSEDLRAFSTTTTGQMRQIAADINRVAGPEGSLLKFADETRKAMNDADIASSSKAARLAAERTALAADDLRRALPEIRDTLGQLRELAGHLDEQPESMVYGPRPAKSTPR